jgi:hypothetical protein
MPALTGRGNTLTNIQNFAITDNPVFRVKIRSLATNFEQPAGEDSSTKSDDPVKKFKMGNIVTGVEKENHKKAHVGKVIKINRNSGSITIIDNKDNEKYILDASSCKLEKKKETNEMVHNQRLLSLFEFENRKNLI